MSQTRSGSVSLLDGVGIFFGCGHHFVKTTESPPLLSTELRDQLLCPLCHSHECLACNATFSGWLDTCSVCYEFCMLEAVTDEFAAKGIDKIDFKKGILLVPGIGNEKSRVVDWVEALSLGVGHVELTGAMDDDGDSYDIERLELQLTEISRLDPQGHISSDRLSEPLRIYFRSIETGVTPEHEREYAFIRIV